MKFSASFVALALVATVFAQHERPKDEQLAKEVFDSGRKHMSLMERKESGWAAKRDTGAFDSSNLKAIDEVVKCVNGTAVAVEGDALQTFR